MRSTTHRDSSRQEAVDAGDGDDEAVAVDGGQRDGLSPGHGLKRDGGWRSLGVVGSGLGPIVVEANLE